MKLSVGPSRLFSSGERKVELCEVQHLKVLDTLAIFSAILYKGDNFTSFLHGFLHTKPLLKMSLL